jgi:hypothetical protein
MQLFKRMGFGECFVRCTAGSNISVLFQPTCHPRRRPRLPSRTRHSQRRASLHCNSGTHAFSNVTMGGRRCIERIAGGRLAVVIGYMAAMFNLDTGFGITESETIDSPLLLNSLFYSSFEKKDGKVRTWLYSELNVNGDNDGILLRYHIRSNRSFCRYRFISFIHRYWHDLLLSTRI